MREPNTIARVLKMVGQFRCQAVLPCWASGIRITCRPKFSVRLKTIVSPQSPIAKSLSRRRFVALTNQGASDLDTMRRVLHLCAEQSARKGVSSRARLD